MAKISVGTVVAAISAAEALTPAFVQLIEEVKSLFDAPDQATIEAALANLDAAADAAHTSAQALEGPAPAA